MHNFYHRRLHQIIIFLFMFYQPIWSQISVSGKVIGGSTKEFLNGVKIELEDTGESTFTDIYGAFLIETDSILKNNLTVTLAGYVSQKMTLSNTLSKSIDVGLIILEKEVQEQELTTIILDENELYEDEGMGNYTAGFFHNTNDIYLKASSFSFSQVWYKVKGYDSSKSVVLFNGIKFNKFYSGRPNWSNWGGLNDVLKSNHTDGFSPIDTNFGNVSNTSSYTTDASSTRKGFKISSSLTNRNYKNRVMFTYASGFTKKNWAITTSASYRYAKEGGIKGTPYKSWAYFLAVEKILTKNHRINLSSIISYNYKGKYAPLTQEVINLKGKDYNPYWGIQNGKIRNSRTKKVFEPILLLSHHFSKNKFSLKSSFAYQFGATLNSRLGYFNAPNPSPIYWKYLPSSFLRKNYISYENAYLAQKNIVENGQLNWTSLYEKNKTNGSSLYYLHNDVNKDIFWAANSSLKYSFSDKTLFQASIQFRKLKSENYSLMEDLLGGTEFVDINPYEEGEGQQNNLQNPNNVVQENDAFQYHYVLYAKELELMTQLSYVGKKIDYFIGTHLNTTNYQRNGFYQNGVYKNNSYGLGNSLKFNSFGIKSGITYKISGRNLAALSVLYLGSPPSVKNAYSNIRINHTTSPNLDLEQTYGANLVYLLRYPRFEIKTTAFLSLFKNATKSSFYYADGLQGDQSDFVSEMLTGVNTKHLGIELGGKYIIQDGLNILAAVSLGNYQYTNNPNLYLFSNLFSDENSHFGKAYIKNYPISGTPQQALFLGFEYNDPNYWWLQINANWLSKNYVNIAPITRTRNFYADENGIPFIDPDTGEEVTQNQVQELLKQELLDEVFLLNLSGGKSWKIKDTYLLATLSVNNLTNGDYKIAGFNQSRNANYLELKNDKTAEIPRFGNKYWSNQKINFFLNFSVRF